LLDICRQTWFYSSGFVSTQCVVFFWFSAKVHKLRGGADTQTAQQLTNESTGEKCCDVIRDVCLLMLTSCLCENPGTDDEVMRLLSNTRLRQRQEALYRRGAATSNSPFLCVTFDCCENFDPVSFQTTRDRQKFLQRIPTCLGGTEGSFFGSECLSTLSLRSCSHVVVSSNGLMHCFAICRVQGKRQTRRVARML